MYITVFFSIFSIWQIWFSDYNMFCILFIIYYYMHNPKIIWDDNLDQAPKVWSVYEERLRAESLSRMIEYAFKISDLEEEKKRDKQKYETLLVQQQESNPMISSLVTQTLNNLWWVVDNQAAVRSAIAAIMTSSLSHNVGKWILAKDIPHKEIDDFVVMLWWPQGIQEKQPLYKQLFLRDCQKLITHPWYQRYQELRSSWLSVDQSLRDLPWKENMLNTMLDSSATTLPKNTEIFEGSDIWDLSFCMGRVYTILWILTLAEGEEYVANHIKFAEVIRDGSINILDTIPNHMRDESFLIEYLNYEDSHGTLFIDDKEFDPNSAWIQQLGITPEKNVSLIWKWNILDTIYELYFVEYIKLLHVHGKIDANRKSILIKYVRQFSKKIGNNQSMLTFLINLDPEREQEYFDELQKLASIYPVIKDEIWYVLLEQDDNGNPSIERIEQFIHDKYGPMFSFEDVHAAYVGR